MNVVEAPACTETCTGSETSPRTSLAHLGDGRDGQTADQGGQNVYTEGFEMESTEDRPIVSAGDLEAEMGSFHGSGQPVAYGSPQRFGEPRRSPRPESTSWRGLFRHSRAVLLPGSESANAALAAPSPDPQEDPIAATPAKNDHPVPRPPTVHHLAVMKTITYALSMASA